MLRLQVLLQTKNYIPVHKNPWRKARASPSKWRKNKTSNHWFTEALDTLANQARLILAVLTWWAFLSHSFSAREASTYFSPISPFMSREVLLQQPLKLQDRYIIEREHIDQNFQAIARSPCSYEGHVTSLAKDHVYVVRRKIMDMCWNLWILR